MFLIKVLSCPTDHFLGIFQEVETTCNSQEKTLTPVLSLNESAFLPRSLPGGSAVENLPARQETWVHPLGWEDPLEEGMATHSSILAWRTPWTEEPSGLQSTGLQKVRDD